MPKDYIFVSKGDPYITRHCKSHTKDEGGIIYVVYVRPVPILSLINNAYI